MRFAPLALLIASVYAVPPKDDVVCKGAHCYPRVFQASHEFQPVLPDQEIPKGLHVRWNINTGQLEAKLMAEGDAPATHELVVQPPSEGSVVPPAAEPPLPTAAPQTDRQRFTNSVKLVFGALSGGLYGSSAQHVLQALGDLEELVHDIDFGVELVQHALYAKLLRVLEQDKQLDDTMVYKIATIVGSSVQNNPKAQHEALKLDIVARLLSILHVRTEGITSTKPVTRLIYALASMLRNDILGYKAFMSADGPSQLARIFVLPFVQVSALADHHAGGIQHKLITLMTDVADPDMYEHQEHDKVVMMKDGDVLVWCDFMLQIATNTKTLQDVRLDAVRGLVVFRQVYGDKCGNKHKMLEWIQREKQQQAQELLLDELSELHHTLQGE